MLRVILEPLIGNIPLVGAVTMFFIRRPVSVFLFNGFALCSNARPFTYSCLFVCIICVETGHQLDRTYQPLGYPWIEVSLYDGVDLYAHSSCATCRKSWSCTLWILFTRFREVIVYLAAGSTEAFLGIELNSKTNRSELKSPSVHWQLCVVASLKDSVGNSFSFYSCQQTLWVNYPIFHLFLCISIAIQKLLKNSVCSSWVGWHVTPLKQTVHLIISNSKTFLVQYWKEHSKVLIH